jgi:hypothetical protein
MGLQPMGKVPDLRRLAGRVASRATVRCPGCGHSWDSASLPPLRAAQP